MFANHGDDFEVRNCTSDIYGVAAKCGYASESSASALIVGGKPPEVTIDANENASEFRCALKQLLINSFMEAILSSSHDISATTS